MSERERADLERTASWWPSEAVDSYTEDQWKQVDKLHELLRNLSPREQKNKLADLFKDGEDPKVLSLVAFKLRLPPEDECHRIGQKIENFTIKKQIGAGGMGIVYLAEQDFPQREVIVKLIHPALAADPTVAKRFDEEIRILGKMEHAGVAHIYSGGIYTEHTERGACSFPWYAMKYVRGKPITTYVRDADLELTERLELFLEVCQALKICHEFHRIFHRDLKPDHILVDADGNPHLLDFGLAMRFDSSLPQRTKELFSGTPAYMSPEHVTSQFGPIGPSSDVYTLGIILFELLTGRRPYEVPGGPPEKWCQAILGATPPKVGELNTECDRDLEDIVAKAIHKDQNQRYRTVAAFQIALRRYLNKVPNAESHEGVRHGALRRADGSGFEPAQSGPTAGNHAADSLVNTLADIGFFESLKPDALDKWVREVESGISALISDPLNIAVERATYLLKEHRDRCVAETKGVSEGLEDFRRVKRRAKQAGKDKDGLGDALEALMGVEIEGSSSKSKEKLRRVDKALFEIELHQRHRTWHCTDEMVDGLTAAIRGRARLEPGQAAKVNDSAFLLGNLLIVNINAATAGPDLDQQRTVLSNSISSFADSLGLKTFNIPRQTASSVPDSVFSQTLALTQQLRTEILRQQGPAAKDWFWLGVTGALASQFCQNPTLVDQAAPLIAEVESVMSTVRLPEEVGEPFVQALQARDAGELVAATEEFVRGVSDWLHDGPVRGRPESPSGHAVSESRPEYTDGDWITAALVGPERAETVLKGLAADIAFLANEPRANALSRIRERLVGEIENLRERFRQGGLTDEERLDACMAKVVADILDRELNEFLWQVEERDQDDPLQVFRRVIKEFVAREKGSMKKGHS